MPFDGSPLEDCRALVLNGDYRPLSVKPLSTWHWEDAVRAAVAGKVQVLAEYDRVIRSPTVEMRLPSVIALREYQRLDRRAAMTRMNVFVRDGMACQYCGKVCAANGLTFDHVLPRSRGGATSFDNLVAACEQCNLRKANRTPQEARMPLLQKPFHPSWEQLNARAAKLPVPREQLERTWLDWLYWEVELEA